MEKIELYKIEKSIGVLNTSRLIEPISTRDQAFLSNFSLDFQQDNQDGSCSRSRHC